MKKTLLLTTMMATFVAQDAMANVRSFCSKANQQARESQRAINNSGRINGSDSNGNASVKFYRGCRHDISWMQRTREVLCQQKGSVSDIDVPKYIFFVFDGAADFSASRAERIMDIANLDGSEGDDLGQGNMNGGWFFLNRLNDQTLIDRDDMQVHYHASSGLHKRENYDSAIACGKQIDKYLDTLKSVDSSVITPKIATLGFSNGGVNATKFQRDMDRRNVKRPVDLAFTLDPIAKAAAFLFKQGAKFEGKRAKGTKRFVNLYQNVDYGSLGNFKLRGKPVKNADENIHVNHDNSPEVIYSDGQVAHLTMSRSFIVGNTFACEFAKLVENEEAIATDCLNNPFRPRFHEDNSGQ